MTNKEWLEMKDIRKHFFNKSVWIPLKAQNKIFENGQSGKVGYKEEYFAVGSIAVFLDKKDIAEQFDWNDLGLINCQRPCVDINNRYIPSDIREENDEQVGVYLVLSQEGNSTGIGEWHLHQDFVLAYDLKREGDSWLCISEGYTEVARLVRDSKGVQKILEVKAEYLKDYLCARNMILRVSSYRSRMQIVDELGKFSTWEKNPPTEKNKNDRWECRVTATGESGMPYDSETVVLHVSRTDVDPEEDVPEFDFPTDNVVSSKSWIKKEAGRKLYRIHGELWRNEWVEPADLSSRIRNDKTNNSIYFIINSEGNKETKDALKKAGRWLWFKSEIVMEILSIRESFLSWYTKDTGSISCSPNQGVHFGINRLGLINVYAKDIALLPNWQQKIWAGFNIGPDGKVSEELLSSQMKATPAKTQAPENYLESGCLLIDKTFQNNFGQKIFRGHEQKEELLRASHRFRSTDQTGLFALAKDLTKLVVEDIDTEFLRSLINVPNGKDWKSIKLLENLLASIITPEESHKITAPLVGINKIRQADAHLKSHEINDSLLLAGINLESNPIEQGYQMLSTIVTTLYKVSELIEKLPVKNK